MRHAITNELTMEEHSLLRKQPKKSHEEVHLYQRDITEGYYMFYIYPSYIKLINKNNIVKLYHRYCGATLGYDMQRAMKRATGVWVLQRDIRQRFYNGSVTHSADLTAINNRRSKVE